MVVLVTGGSGYIGSHVVKLLNSNGEKVIIVDEVAPPSVLAGNTSYLMDIADHESTTKLAQIMTKEGVDSIIHFAARKQVGESIQKPLWYYRQNVGGLLNLLEAMKVAGVKKIIFSSSAAVYGIPPTDEVTERSQTNPINPYGETKLIGEWILNNAKKTMGVEHVSLRYFNVAGAATRELNDPHAFNLIPIVFDRLNRGLSPVIYGNDYPTKDGTCIRDYVHVADLADAHIAALNYLSEPNREYVEFNVGTGKGSSVLEVLEEIQKVTGKEIVPEFSDRRKGDPPQLTSNVDRIFNVLNWKAKYDIAEIINSAWIANEFRMQNPEKI